VEPALPASRWLPPVVGLAALACTLHSWLPASAFLSPAALDRRDLLRGTWLREYAEGGVQVRRVLELQADGAFHELVRIAEPAGRVTRMEHEGTWIYDGTNLKRKYSRMNGDPPSRLHVPFATFEVAFEGRDDFVGIDHVHGVRVEYQRVPDDTQP
jgi:hypothetical protein